jgi:hypothetical protein
MKCSQREEVPREAWVRRSSRWIKPGLILLVTASSALGVARERNHYECLGNGRFVFEMEDVTARECAMPCLVITGTVVTGNLPYCVRARADRVACRSPYPKSHPPKLEAIEPRTIAIITRFFGRLIY